MSYSRSDQPSDLADDSLNRNPEFTKPHPYKMGQAITIKSCKFCLYCGWQFSQKLPTCPECGSPKSQLFKENQLIKSLVPRNVTAQSRREVPFCWNQDEDPVSGEIRRHKLDAAYRTVVDLQNKETFQEEYDKNCGIAYSWKDGRAATDAEIAQATAGKLPLKAKIPDVAGSGS